jgi:hypothetical protein
MSADKNTTQPDEPQTDPTHQAIIITCLAVMVTAALVAVALFFTVGISTPAARSIAWVTAAGAVTLFAADLWFGWTR